MQHSAASCTLYLMNSANDTNAQTRNATHSIAICALGEEVVVSCFPLVAGEPDTDTEVFFETFTDAAVARRFYARKCALLACKAADFDAEIDWVYRAASSLASCLYREVPNEARRLAAAVAELELATLARRDATRTERKARALAHAADVLARRLARLHGAAVRLDDNALDAVT